MRRPDCCSGHPTSIQDKIIADRKVRGLKIVFCIPDRAELVRFYPATDAAPAKEKVYTRRLESDCSHAILPASERRDGQPIALDRRCGGLADYRFRPRWVLALSLKPTDPASRPSEGFWRRSPWQWF
jgi:hypothetical protein